MYSSVSPKDEIWFLRVCHHISTGLYDEVIPHPEEGVFVCLFVIWIPLNEAPEARFGLLRRR
jgi:hypothetical protein